MRKQYLQSHVSTYLLRKTSKYLPDFIQIFKGMHSYMNLVNKAGHLSIICIISLL